MADKVPTEVDERGFGFGSGHEKDEFATGSTTVYRADVEEIFAEVGEVKQGLKQRHIQMIALAGTIGTGLFLGSGKALAEAGPLGALLGYTLTGLLAAAVVLAVGEMGTLLPLTGGVVRYADLWVDPALSFANGWNLVYNYMVSIPAEIVAAAALIQFWTDVSSAIFITVFGVLTILASILFVRIYGELEFGFAMLKIMLVFMVNFMALVITAGGGPDGKVIGFKYWHHPGPFVQYLDVPGVTGRFMGFWTVFTNALYAYSGIETITIAAAEVDHPRRAIPLAAKRIFWRILIFYVITLFFIGMVVPSDNDNLLSGSGAAESPFVIAANIAGIGVVPHIINAVVITSAWSAANSFMLGGSRTLFGLARQNRAPKVFLRLNRFGIPWVAVCYFALFCALGYMSLGDSASTAFQWLQDLISISTLVNWMVILTTYLRFYYGMKAQGIDRKTLPWAAPLQPYISWVSLVIFGLIFLTSGYSTFIKHNWSTETFVSSYVELPIMFLLYFGYKVKPERKAGFPGFRLTWRSKIVSLNDMPLTPFVQSAIDNPEPPEEPKTGLARFNILWS